MHLAIFCSPYLSVDGSKKATSALFPMVSIKSGGEKSDENGTILGFFLLNTQWVIFYIFTFAKCIIKKPPQNNENKVSDKKKEE